MVLHSSEPNGICYIQTSNIDGESDLKLRKAPRALEESMKGSQREVEKKLSQTPLEIFCSQPDSHIYKFDAKWGSERLTNQIANGSRRSQFDQRQSASAGDASAEHALHVTVFRAFHADTERQCTRGTRQSSDRTRASRF